MRAVLSVPASDNLRGIFLGARAGRRGILTGQYDEAETNFLESLRLREKIHGGKKHPDIGQSLHNIALL